MAALRHVLFAATAAIATPATVAAEGNCTTVDVDFLPAALPGNVFAPQIVAWLEEPNGTFRDTMFITAETGTFGLGNRPGRFDFNSGPAWPYGRRITTFPIWAHRHGLEFPEIAFRNADEDNLSHPFNESSRETHYCRPLEPTEPSWDALSCPSQAFTDKGTIAGVTATSKYPPRNDVEKSNTDDPSVEMYAVLNPFDAVSQATPRPGTVATFSYAVPEDLPFGSYVMFVEVSREFDMNSTYNATTFPAPTGISFGDYGEPYRGQPSVLYKVDVVIDAAGVTTSSTLEYVGYADPTGLTGTVRPPDSTITSNIVGSGALRLGLVSIDGNVFRVRATSRPQFDFVAPVAPGQAQVISATANSATLGWVAPGDDAAEGKAKKYEIRFRVGEAIDATNFESSTVIGASPKPAIAGTVQTLVIPGLLPETDYSVGIRAIDDCRNASEVAVVTFTTPDRASGDVDSCFVATAAYGSALAGDVDMLRRFRDVVMRKTVFGELAVEAYYTIGPAISGLIGESDLLRATARGALEPIVGRVRGFTVAE
jgi:hypothetical protein